jgi:hypothetical protein
LTSNHLLCHSNSMNDPQPQNHLRGSTEGDYSDGVDTSIPPNSTTQPPPQAPGSSIQDPPSSKPGSPPPPPNPSIIPVDPNAPKPPVVPTPPPKVRKSLIISVVVILLIALASLAAYFLLKPKPAEAPPIQNPASTIIQDLGSPTPTPNPTADWRTHTNSTYSFKYPNNATINVQEASLTTVYYWGSTQEPNTELYDGYSVTFQPFELPGVDPIERARYQLDQSLQTDLVEVVNPIESITVNNYTGASYTTSGLGESTQYILKSNDGIMLMEIHVSHPDPNNQGYKDITDQILSTFTFLDEANQTPTIPLSHSFTGGAPYTHPEALYIYPQNQTVQDFTPITGIRYTNEDQNNEMIEELTNTLKQNGWNFRQTQDGLVYESVIADGPTGSSQGLLKIENDTLQLIFWEMYGCNQQSGPDCTPISNVFISDPTPISDLLTQ